MGNNKIFLTIDNQIKHLINNRKLIIKNKDKLRYYLSRFNYQQFINGYNDYFMVNFDRKSNLYSTNVNSNHIIDLYNFDKELHSILLSDILKIESFLASLISYYIMEKNQNIKCLKTGQILRCSDKELLIIFPGLNKYNSNFKTQCNKSNFSIYENISIIRKCLKGYIREKDKIACDNKVNDLPLWKLSIYWSFGDAIKIFNVLPKSIKKIIVFEFFKQREWWENYYIHFEKTLVMLNDLRNAICHDNVLFNFRYENRNIINDINRFYEKITIYKSNVIQVRFNCEIKNLKKIKTPIKININQTLNIGDDLIIKPNFIGIDKIQNFKWQYADNKNANDINWKDICLIQNNDDSNSCFGQKIFIDKQNGTLIINKITKEIKGKFIRFIAIDKSNIDTIINMKKVIKIISFLSPINSRLEYSINTKLNKLKSKIPDFIFNEIVKNHFS